MYVTYVIAVVVVIIIVVIFWWWWWRRGVGWDYRLQVKFVGYDF